MNLNDLLTKLRTLEEGNEVAPVHTDSPGAGAGDESVEECGGIMVGGPAPIPGMMGGAPKQADNVDMNITLHGSGAGGVRDLMNILHNIEAGAGAQDHGGEHDHSEPIMGDMVKAMADEQMQFQPEQGLEEVQDDDGQTWGNSAYGDSGHHVHGIDSITMHGDDMNSKGGHEPHKRQGGGNPYNESLVNRLSQMYQEIKEDAGGPINPNAKCNICHTPYAKHFRFDPPGDPTGKRTSTLIRSMCGAVPQNFPDLYSMSESDKKTMSRAAKGVAEAAKWRDPKHKDKLYTQEPRSDEDDYYGDDDYYNPKPDDYPGAKNLKGGGEFDHNDQLKKGYGRYGTGSPVEKGPRKGLPSRNHITSLKGSIKNAHGKHHAPNLPEQMNESVELNDMLALNKRLNG